LRAAFAAGWERIRRACVRLADCSLPHLTRWRRGALVWAGQGEFRASARRAEARRQPRRAAPLSRAWVVAAWLLGIIINQCDQ
jgi:hypothetical protein